MHIDHTTIRTTKLTETRDFFASVFDLKEGKRPAVIANNIPGYWMYWQSEPLVHIIYSGRHYGDVPSTEAIDHTAFYMENYDGFKSKLQQLGIRFSLMDLPELNERRIFLYTPTGILLEAVFRE